MAIPDTISAALADKPEVLTYVKDLDAKAEKFTPDIEKALPDLPKLGEFKASATALQKVLGELKAKDADALITDFRNILAVKEDLLKQKKEGKLGGDAGDPTKAPEYKALEERMAAMKGEFDGKLKILTDEAEARKTEAATALTAQRDSDLKSSILSAAAKNKIRDPEDEFLLLKAKGLVGHKEDGKPFFYKLNDKNEKVDAGSAEALMKHIAETFKSKVDASSKGGTGQQHTGQGGGEKEIPKTAAEARGAFLRK